MGSSASYDQAGPPNASKLMRFLGTPHSLNLSAASSIIFGGPQMKNSKLFEGSKSLRSETLK